MTTPTCATGCARPSSPLSPRAALCVEHDAEWKASGECKRLDALLYEYPPLIERTKEQASELAWRAGIALGDCVRRIGTEVAAVKLGKPAEMPTPSK